MQYLSGDHAEPRGFIPQQIETQRLSLRLARGGVDRHGPIDADFISTPCQRHASS